MKKFTINLPAWFILFALGAGGAFAATFADDLTFLRPHSDLVVLSDGAARVALSPTWEGRVLTSSAEGDAGPSYGWINRELIASGKLLPHINAFGGEDRFWMGPEGGQYSLFFAPGTKFDLANWFTPPIFDTLPFTVLAQSTHAVRFGASFELTNYSGTRFEVSVDREVHLLPAAGVWQELGVPAAPNVSLVAFESVNRVTNVGKESWRKDRGLLSVWILGMYNPSPATTIVVPIKGGADSELGPRLTSDYFGPVPADRLVVRDRVIFFSGDGTYRSKIGISPRRSRAVLGSYDARNQVLTLIKFTQPADAVDYVNSLWKIQDHPYRGDAANCYNDGPPQPGAKPLGPFYELESSSPAAALAPGESLTHVHRTIHLHGPAPELDAVARAVLGVSLDEITGALQR